MLAELGLATGWITMRTILILLAGAAALLAAKYLIFGLIAWDKTLHPERLEIDIKHYPAFTLPLLGLFSRNIPTVEQLAAKPI